MREPMTDRDRVLLLCIYIISITIFVLILWAVYLFAVPWIADQLQKQIDGQYDVYSWSTGIIQNSPLPTVRVYAGYTINVWE
jgi:Fe2+ transport system protein B